jgi:hypothetical protein
MMRRSLLVLPFATLLTGCSTETGRLREARDGFYTAVATYDFASLRSAVTPDYLEVDRGRLLGADSLISELGQLAQQNGSLQYEFADSAVRVEPPFGWAVYRARTILNRPARVDTLYTMESATFRREGSGWKLALLHRTPLSGPGGTFQPDSATAVLTVTPPPVPQPNTSRAPARE